MARPLPSARGPLGPQFLFIATALRSFAPTQVAFGRVLVGSALLAPFALTTPLTAPVSPGPGLALLALGLGGTGLASVL